MTNSDQQCDHQVRTIGGRVWVCVRPEHDWEQEGSANYRRQQGKTINPDRHVMVRASDSGCACPPGSSLHFDSTGCLV